jgi:tetratricopeptide (TPR) repeat protein
VALKNPRPVLFAGGILLALIAVWLLFVPRNRKGRVVRLGGLTWKRNQFCRGWLITGDTGSGKTSSGINQLAHQVFQNEPKWGGLCIDEKGVYWETLAAMAKQYDREHDLVHLQIRTDDTDTQWTPPNRYNLTGDRSIPFTTYAKFIVDTATSLGQGGDKGFFKSQAQTHIAHALELLFELNRPVTLLNAFELLSDRDLLEEAMEDLEPLLETPRRAAVYGHFANRFLNQPEEQHGGVRETIGNYLQYFLTPEVAEVFCTGESTFDFASIDQGKIIVTTMPQKFQTERRYVNTFLKLLYYNHALRRFDKAKAERAKNSLLILWADEAQRFMTASEDGTSDYNCVDVIREAGATVVAAAQSTTALVPPLGNDKAKVLTLNLRNRLIFRAADEQ